jgi:hypothetical protein
MKSPHEKAMTQDNDEDIAYRTALQSVAGSAAPAPARETTQETTGQFSGAFSAHQEYHGEEKRRTPRYKCEGKVEICEPGCDVNTSATLTDVSLHGCYVETQATYPVGTTLAVKLKTAGRKVEVTGVVRVNYPSLGMGIAFVEMTDSNRTELKNLLASMSRPMMIMRTGTFSSPSAHKPPESAPPISDPMAAMQALLDFFEGRQMLVREDFLRILRQSQNANKP